MDNRSIWQCETQLPQFPKLQKDIKTDVLIIGGGAAGLLTAYLLHQSGVKYILTEKGRICGGTTGKTTAKITFQHGLIYADLLKSMGEECARGYLLSNRAAFDKIAELSKRTACHYEIKDNYVYSVNDEKKITRELAALSKIGYNAEFVIDLPIPIQTAGGVKFPRQAEFNPLEFFAFIAKDLNIYENSFVTEMLNNTAVCNGYKIHAKRVVVATHFPFINKHGSYFLKMYQHRSYVLALENAPKVNGMYVDESKSGFSFRNYKNYLLLGGGSHRTGKKGGNYNELSHFADLYYPEATEKYRWATQDCMSLDGVPYVGEYSRNTHNLFVASGFNKWGMTGSMLAAMLLTDRLTGKNNAYAELYDPSRSILKQQLIVNAFEAVTNLLTPTAKRCPHLGCALKWNSAEHTWDCPCHGSRFDCKGQVLDNPANGNIKKK